MQTPPTYSAKKIGGIAAHRLARRDRPVEPAPVRVTVHDLSLLGFDDGLVRLRLTVSAGFYVRSLAHELGEKLGCGAHLEALRRTAAGAFGLDGAVPLDQLEAEGTDAEGRLIPMERLLPEIPSVRLNERGTSRVSHGNWVSPAEFAQDGHPISEGKVRLLDDTGRLLAIANASGDGLLRPAVVLV